METSTLLQIVLPLSLFIIMIGMGLSLTLSDFKRLYQYPKATIVGLINQIILLPLIGFALIKIFNLEPTLAIGVMLIAACPGGVTSNLISHVSKGDTALSVTLTAISTFISLISLPIIVAFSLRHFMGADQYVDINEIDIVKQVIAIVIVPVVIGMLIRSRSESFALKMDKPFRIASTVLFFVIVLGIIAKERETLLVSFTQVGFACLALNICTMLVGFLTAKLANLTLKQTITVAIESGIQNGTLAIVIATTIIQDSSMTIAPGVYSILMFFTGGYMMLRFGKNKALRA